jgi:hypothetical protein
VKQRLQEPTVLTAEQQRLRFGATALQGATESEQQSLRIGYIMTIVLTGQQYCCSLTTTAQTGGC